MRTAIEHLSDYLVGRDPSRIEDHWQVLIKGGFYRGGAALASAVSGIDQAFWDIAGKSLGVPVHRLLGGAVPDRIRAHGWVGGDNPSKVGDHIAAQIAVGLTAVKTNASGKMSRIGSVRELDGGCESRRRCGAVLGPDRDVAVDFHGRFTLANTRRVAPLLGEFYPFFLEEPVVPENSHLIGEFARSTTIPVATGERLYNPQQDFLPVLQAGIAVAQPDLSPAGDISEVRRIAAMAELFDVQLAPHCPLPPSPLRPACRWDSGRPIF